MKISSAERANRVRRIMSQSTGTDAIRTAKEIERLKNAKALARRHVRTTHRQALGRDFVWDGATHVDARYSPSDQVLHLKAYGPAFFQMLRIRPDLKTALMLGDSVKISLGGGKALWVSPRGENRVDPERLSRFVRPR